MSDTVRSRSAGEATTGRFTLVGEALLPAGRRRAAILVEDGIVGDVLEDARDGDLPSERRQIAGLIAPGFIDLQVNGAFGADVGTDRAAFETLCRELPRTGVTAYLPTAISWPRERYAGLFAAIDAVAGAPGARILGVHLEGPFLAPTRKGAHDPRNLQPIDLALLRDMLSSGHVRLMTLAPELAGALEAIEMLVAEGAVASAGHTDATYEQIERAADTGVTMGTHLFNAMSGLMHRAPGAVGAVLSDPRLRAGLIADGVHVHPAALRVAHRAKGAAGIALVTDAMQAAGLADGRYELSGRAVDVTAGEARLPDGTLAGSALTMDEAVRRAAAFLKIPLEEAVRMATSTPADALGLEREGRITPGANADLIVLSGEGIIEETIIGGTTIYRRAAA